MILAIALSAMSCKDNSGRQNGQDLTMQNEEETMQNDQDEFQSLFNGKDLDGWKAYNSNEITQWTVEDNALVFTKTEGERDGSENLITRDQYTNFELSLEWKISEAGNSGIMWGVQEGENFDEPYRSGPEIQILDNEKHPDAKNGPIRQAGALYDMVPPKRDVTKPVGQWNETLIKIDHKANRGSVSLNGILITEFPLHGEEWDALVENSKFRDWEHFGKFKTGHIALQDHHDKVWFKNIKIRELN